MFWAGILRTLISYKAGSFIEINDRIDYAKDPHLSMHVWLSSKIYDTHRDPLVCYILSLFYTSLMICLLIYPLQGYAQEGIDVSKFGAVGDGVTDDTPALVAALASSKGVAQVVQLQCGKTYRLKSSLDLTLSEGSILRGCFPAHDDPGGWRGLESAFDRLGSILRDPTARITIGRSSGVEDVIVRQSDLPFPQKDDSNFAGTAIATKTGHSGKAAFVHNVLVLGAQTCLDDSDGGDRIDVKDFYCDGENGEIVGPSFDTSVFINVHNWPFMTVDGGKNHRVGVGLQISGASDDSVFSTIFDYGHRVGFLFDSNQHGNFHVEHLWADNNGQACVRIVGGRGINIASLTAYTCGTSIDIEKNAEVQITQAFLVSSEHECVQLDGTLSFALLHLEQCHGGGIHVVTPRSVLSVGFLQVLDLRAPWTISVPPEFPTDRLGIHDLFTDAPPGASLYKGEGPVDPTLAAAPVLDLPPNAGVIRLNGSGLVKTLRGGWGGRTLSITSVNATAAVALGGNIMLTNGVVFGGHPGGVLSLRYDAAMQRWLETARSRP